MPALKASRVKWSKRRVPGEIRVTLVPVLYYALPLEEFQPRGTVKASKEVREFFSCLALFLYCLY
jgi:hypothetical protein